MWLPLFRVDLVLPISCLTLTSCTKELVAGRTGSTYEDMPITGLEKADERGQERCYGSLSNQRLKREDISVTLTSRLLDQPFWVGKRRHTPAQTSGYTHQASHEGGRLKTSPLSDCQMTQNTAHTLILWICIMSFLHLSYTIWPKVSYWIHILANWTLRPFVATVWGSPFAVPALLCALEHEARST